MERLARFGDFVILEPHGTDAAGDCYRAAVVENGKVSRFVHLRVLARDLAADGAFVSALRKSVLIGSQFDHTNAIRAEGTGVVGSEPYLVREYLGGARLNDLLARCKKEMYPLGVDHAIFVMTSVLAALEHMHGKKVEGRRVTHAGLGSAVVGVSFEGDVKLLDWELYEALPAPVLRQLLGTQVVHMAPEVRQGQPCTPRSNVYSVGTMLVEVLARKLPPADIPDPAVLVGQINLKGSMSPAGAEKMKEILKRCLAADPAQRYDDVREIRAGLDDVVAAEGVEVSHFNFALFMHSLFRVETEEEAERLDADRALRLSSPVSAEPEDQTILAADLETASGLDLHEEETIVSDRPFTPTPPPPPPRAASPPVESAVDAEERTMLAVPAAAARPVAAPANPGRAAPEERTMLAPPPSPVAAKPPPPPPRPVVPDLEELVPASAPAPAKGGLGAKHVLLLGIVSIVVVLVAVGVFLLTRGGDTGKVAAPTDPSSGGITQPRGPIGSPSPTPTIDATPTPGGPPTGTPPLGATPVPATPPRGTTTPPATPAATPSAPPATVSPTPGSPADAAKEELANATNEARRLVGAGKPQDAGKVLDALVAKYPDLAGSVKPLRDEVKKKQDELAAADKAAKADAEAKAAEEAKQRDEAIEAAAGEVADLLAAGKASEARGKLDANPELAGSPRGGQLRSQIEAALAVPVASVKEGDLVDASSGGVTAPRLQKKAEAKYPPIARRQRVSGQVTVSALVGVDGRVEATKILSASSNPSGNWGLQQAAEEAARACEFHPAQKEGVKVKMWISIPFAFHGE